MTISLHSSSTRNGTAGTTATTTDGATRSDVMAEESPEAKHRGALHFIGVGLSAGALTLVLAFAAILIVVPWVAGATPMTILTSSMEPTLPPGTLVVVKPEPITDIRIGDVMTYQFESGKPAVVSHRVISESVSADGARTFITKGDNNAVADPNPVVAGQVRGVVWYSIPWIGYVSTAINGSNRSWIVPAIAVVLIGYAGYMILGGVLDARKKRRSAAGSTAK